MIDMQKYYMNKIAVNGTTPLDNEDISTKPAAGTTPTKSPAAAPAAKTPTASTTPAIKPAATKTPVTKAPAKPAMSAATRAREIAKYKKNIRDVQQRLQSNDPALKDDRDVMNYSLNRYQTNLKKLMGQDVSEERAANNRQLQNLSGLQSAKTAYWQDKAKKEKKLEDRGYAGRVSDNLSGWYNGATYGLGKYVGITNPETIKRLRDSKGDQTELGRLGLTRSALGGWFDNEQDIMANAQAAADADQGYLMYMSDEQLANNPQALAMKKALLARREKEHTQQSGIENAGEWATDIGSLFVGGGGGLAGKAIRGAQGLGRKSLGAAAKYGLTAAEKEAAKAGAKNAGVALAKMTGGLGEVTANAAKGAVNAIKTHIPNIGKAVIKKPKQAVSAIGKKLFGGGARAQLTTMPTLGKIPGVGKVLQTTGEFLPKTVAAGIDTARAAGSKILNAGARALGPGGSAEGLGLALDGAADLAVQTGKAAGGTAKYIGKRAFKPVVDSLKAGKSAMLELRGAQGTMRAAEEALEAGVKAGAKGRELKGLQASVKAAEDVLARTTTRTDAILKATLPQKMLRVAGGVHMAKDLTQTLATNKLEDMGILDKELTPERLRDNQTKYNDAVAVYGSKDKATEATGLNPDGTPSTLEKVKKAGGSILDAAKAHPFIAAGAAYMLYKMFFGGNSYQMGPMGGYQMGPQQGGNIVTNNPMLSTAVLGGGALYAANEGAFGKGMENWWSDWMNNSKATDKKTEGTSVDEKTKEELDKGIADSEAIVDDASQQQPVE